MKTIEDIQYALSQLQKTDYDVDVLLESMYHQITQLRFFYEMCKARNKTPETCFYSLRNVPKEHELVYVNIGRGFPKEIMDGHWCYVLKKTGSKIIIIPTTSLKKDSTNSLGMKMEIDTIILGTKDKSVLSFSDIRGVDMQRVDERKPYGKVLTDRDEILKKLNQIISDKV